MDWAEEVNQTDNEAVVVLGPPAEDAAVTPPSRTTTMLSALILLPPSRQMTMMNAAPLGQSMGCTQSRLMQLAAYPNLSVPLQFII